MKTFLIGALIVGSVLVFVLNFRWFIDELVGLVIVALILWGANSVLKK